MSQLLSQRPRQCSQEVGGLDRRNLSVWTFLGPLVCPELLHGRETSLSSEPLYSWFCHSRLTYSLVNTDGSEINRKQTGKVRFEIVLSDFFFQLKLSLMYSFYENLFFKLFSIEFRNKLFT